MLSRTVLIALSLCQVARCWALAEDAFQLEAKRGENVHRTLHALPSGAFSIEAVVDPSAKPGRQLTGRFGVCVGMG